MTEEVYAVLAVGNSKTKVIVIDLSTSGTKIAYAGTPLKQNTDVDIVSDSLFAQKPSQVMWSKPLDDERSMMGLRFNEIV